MIIKQVQIVLFSALVILSTGSSSALAGEGFLSWDSNTESDLAGYKIHLGTEPGNYVQTIDVGNSTQNLITGLPENVTYFFLVVTAYDDSSNESGFSEEVSKLVDNVPVDRSLISGEVSVSDASSIFVTGGCRNTHATLWLCLVLFGLWSLSRGRRTKISSLC